MTSRPLAPFQSSACSTFTATTATLQRPQPLLGQAAIVASTWTLPTIKGASRDPQRRSGHVQMKASGLSTAGGFQRSSQQ